MSLRLRILLAFAYGFLLILVALEVPLALNLRDRVDSEVRAQARNQADVVAATGVPPLEMIGAFACFAAATTASRSRTMIFIIGAPGSAMSWRGSLRP